MSHQLPTLQEAAARYRGAWKRACNHDHIAPCGSFVVFSPDNPHAAALDAASAAYSDAVLRTPKPPTRKQCGFLS